MRVLDGNPHLLQGENRVTAQVGGHVVGGQIEVAGVVDRLGRLAVLEVEVLDLGADVHDVAGICRLLDHAAQHVARVAVELHASGRADVAEHAGNAVVFGPPRQDLERARIGKREHVGLGAAGKALDRAAVEAQPFRKCRIELARGDCEGLHLPHHIGKPHADEVDMALVDRLEDVIGVCGVGAAEETIQCIGHSSVLFLPAVCLIVRMIPTRAKNSSSTM